jgi:hypothetical protein
VREAPPGVNVAGYINTESGMGEAVRASIRSIDAAGLPHVLNNVDSLLRKQDASYGGFTRANPHPFNLVHLNADNMAAFAAAGAAGNSAIATRSVLVLRLSIFRMTGCRPTCADEVWVATEFTRACLAQRATVPS